MHVLIIGINYRPELTGIGPYTTALAENLAARGDHVTVLTGLPHYPDWRIAPGTRRALVSSATIDGVTVIRAAHHVPKTQSAMKRAMYEASFGLTSLFASLRLRRPDAIVGVVPSLSGGVLARLTGQRVGVPFGLLFQDLMGRAARQSGMAGGSTAATAAAALEAWATKGARAVGVVTEGFTPYLVSLGVEVKRIHHVPNWSRVSPPSMSAAEIRERFGWTDDQQVVLHAGNMGLKQGLEQVVEAARVASRRADPVRFVFSGGGNQEAAIRAAAKDQPNVSFVGLQPEAIHASLLAAADVLLVSERPTQLDMSLPSKLTSYFAAGRPLVAAVPLEAGSASEVRRSGAGLVVPSGDPERLLEALGQLRSQPALAARLAVAGKVYAQANTSVADCLPRAIALVDSIAGHASASVVHSLETAL